jgi:hypothetical protein
MVQNESASPQINAYGPFQRVPTCDALTPPMAATSVVDAVNGDVAPLRAQPLVIATIRVIAATDQGVNFRVND